MRALWLDGGRVTLADVPDPVPGAGEALVRVRRAGVCNTDLELLRGYAAFTGVPGHEMVGVVEEAPAALDWVGRRVVAEINIRCGACRECRAGRGTHCERRTVMGIRGRPGAFAERVAVPLANLHAVPDELADDAAVFTEPAAAAWRIREQVPLGPGTQVAVLGAGKLGCLVAQALHATGARVRVGARRPERVACLGARGIGVARPEELRERAHDVVVDCTGDPAALAAARRLVRPQGTLVLKSTYAGEARLDASLVVDEITLVGSRCGPFAPALHALAAGTIDVRPLIEATLPLSAGEEALARAGRPGALKILLDCSAG